MHARRRPFPDYAQLELAQGTEPRPSRGDGVQRVLVHHGRSRAERDLEQEDLTPLPRLPTELEASGSAPAMQARTFAMAAALALLTAALLATLWLP